MNQTTNNEEERARQLFEQALEKREQLWDLLEEIESALGLPPDSIQLSDICGVPLWEGFPLPTLNDLLQVRKERLAEEAEEDESQREIQAIASESFKRYRSRKTPLTADPEDSKSKPQ